MVARWHEDSDRWVWAIYDEDTDTEVTKDIYIVPHNDGWYVINATEVMTQHKVEWIARVTNGEGAHVAGPFKELESAKAAWRLIYG